MMFEANMPQSLRVEALFTAKFLTKLLPHTVLGKTSSPFEKLNGVAPQYSALRVLGCACYPYLRPYSHNKFDPKSLVSVFQRYMEKQKGYRCLHPPTERIYISRHVLFDETRFPFSGIYQSCLPQANTSLLTAQFKCLNISPEEVEETVSETLYKEVISGSRRQAPDLQAQDNDANGFQLQEEDFPPLAPAQVPYPIQLQEDNTHNMVTRGKAGVRKPNPRYVLHTVKSFEKPKNIPEALNHPGWKGAIPDEYVTCQETKTWSIVPSPSNAHVLSCGWVHKVKLNADGTVRRFDPDQLQEAMNNKRVLISQKLIAMWSEQPQFEWTSHSHSQSMGY